MSKVILFASPIQNKEMGNTNGNLSFKDKAYNAIQQGEEYILQYRTNGKQLTVPFVQDAGLTLCDIRTMIELIEQDEKAYKVPGTNSAIFRKLQDRGDWTSGDTRRLKDVYTKLVKIIYPDRS